MQNDRGHEIPDKTPVAVPVGYRRPPSLTEQIRMLIRHQMSEQARGEGRETFEEADDFDTGVDDDIRSPYELDDEQQTQPLEQPIERKERAKTGDKEKKTGEESKKPVEKPKKAKPVKEAEEDNDDME